MTLKCPWQPKLNMGSCLRITGNRWLQTTSGALTIWMEFSVIPWRIKMERFIPVESFRKKVITFRGISFFSLLPEFPKISVPFLHSLQCQALHRQQYFRERMLKIWKMAADFQNVYRYNVCLCSSVVLADVLQHNCNPVVVFFFYLHDSGFQRASPWATSWEKMWMLIAGFPDKMRMLQQPKEEIVAFFS